MTDDEYTRLFVQKIGEGKPVLNVRDLPTALTYQITSIALSAKHLGERGNVTFDVEVDGRGALRRVEWVREDGTRTINLRVEHRWYALYQGALGLSVTEIVGDGSQAVDTETMEAVMFLAGVHPTQL